MLVLKNINFKKTHILITVYVILIVTELFFYVPYHKIQVFRSNQNVPHTEIVGSGYATMINIEWSAATFSQSSAKSNVGKRVNTPQILINVSVTTVLAVAIYFLLKENEKIKELPVIDFNALVFCTEEEIMEAQRDYAKKIYEYVKERRI